MATPIIVSGLFGVAFFGAVIYLPVYLQIVKGFEPVASGMLLLPLVLGVFLATAGSGLAIIRTGRYKVYPVAGLAIMVISLVWLSTLDAGTGMWDLSLRIFVLGIGLGLVIQNLVVALQNAAEPRDLGSATSANLFFRSMGGALGTALSVAILAASLSAAISGGMQAEAATLGVEASQLTGAPEVIGELPDRRRLPLLDVFVEGLSRVFLVGVPFAALGFVLMARVRELPLRETSGLEEMETA